MAPGPSKQFDVEGALCAAMHLFHDRGYHGVSLNDLTQAMGIGKKSLYDTFGNKRQLFLRAIRHYVDQTLEQTRSLIMADDDPLRGVHRFLQAVGQRSAQKCSLGCFIGVALADFTDEDEEVSRILFDGLRLHSELFAGFLRQAQQQHQLPADLDVDATARLVTASLQGMALIGRADCDGRFSSGLPEHIITLLQLGAPA